jgi:hypothetical protein
MVKQILTNGAGNLMILTDKGQVWMQTFQPSQALGPDGKPNVVVLWKEIQIPSQVFMTEDERKAVVEAQKKLQAVPSVPAQEQATT